MASDTTTRRGTTTTEIRKVVCQYRRARKLADLLAAESTYGADAWLLHFATQFTVEGWAMVAEKAGITPPSADTIALTIELLRERTEP